MMGILCTEQSCRNLGTSGSACNYELSCELHAPPPPSMSCKTSRNWNRK